MHGVSLNQYNGQKWSNDQDCWTNQIHDDTRIRKQNLDTEISKSKFIYIIEENMLMLSF
jgi:hypothetical protein